MDAFALAEGNLARHLRANRYPGRGLVIGRCEDGAGWLQIYWIMGRSANSRNRRFEVEGATLRTAPVDPAGLEDPTNVIYEAMAELPDVYLVSNGDQTRTLVETIGAGGAFEGALEGREREDDPPHYTPRISGMLDRRGGRERVALSILKAGPADPALTDRATFRPALLPPGVGLGLTTYRGDGDPLPAFQGEPLLLPLPGDVEAVLDRYWDALDPDNRVALAVKRIPATGGSGVITVRNRFGPE